MKIIKIFLMISLFSLTGCVSYQSMETNYKKNACLMLTENYDWFVDLQKSKEKWGVPISIQLAFVKQESNFQYDARPYTKKNGRKKLASSALGYSQALKGTWKEYKTKTKSYGADRTDFTDAIDFMGWYNSKSMKDLKIKKIDAYSLYLAYHEGHYGFKKKTYNKKKWLKKVAKKVQQQALSYSKQLNYCQTIGYY
jgi:hypothetical protein